MPTEPEKPHAIEILPMCPYCKADPIQLCQIPAKFGDMLITMILCRGCRAPVCSFLMGIEVPQPLIDTSGRLPS